MNYINLPDNMYKLPESAINVISTILNKGDVDTIALTNTVWYIISLGIGLVLVLTMLALTVQNCMISQSLGLAIANILSTLFIMMGIFDLFYEPYKLEKELTPLKKEYPMMFIAIYPQKYVLTTNYEVIKLSQVEDGDVIMNIDMKRLRDENPNIFKQIDLLKNGYNKEK